MRATLLLVAVLLLAAGAGACGPTLRMTPIVKFAEDGKVSFPQVDAKTCSICIDVAVEIINYSLNYLLQNGVVNTCEDLCGGINSSAISTICEIGCDLVGLDVFVQILKRTDIDPILYCQLVDMCKVLDCTGQCANVTEVIPDPQEGYQDQHFQIHCAINVTQPAGAGMIRLMIYPDGQPQNGNENDELMPEWDPGYYTFSVDIIPSEAGMTPGNWTFEIMACEGECGSQHEHSAIFSTNSAWILVNQDTKKPYPVMRGHHQRLTLKH